MAGKLPQLLRATSAAISCEEENGGSTFCEAVRALPVSDIPAVAQAVCSVAAAGETPDCLACWGMVAQIAGGMARAPEHGTPAWRECVIHTVLEKSKATLNLVFGISNTQNRTNNR
jgi:hypothetical protein